MERPSLERLRSSGVPTEEVGTDEFDSAAETESPQGILGDRGRSGPAAAGLLPPLDVLRIVVLDAVQDPGNVGTIRAHRGGLRVAATFSLPGTVDLWNAKVVRSGMGAHFHHPCLTGTWDELDSFRRERSVDVWAADAGGESVERTAVRRRDWRLVVGNEGGGLSSQSRERADRLVALPIAADVESLNVAVAAGILLYELRR